MTLLMDTLGVRADAAVDLSTLSQAAILREYQCD